MPAVFTSAARECRWALLNSPRRGRHARSLVWICEYPYRTIRTGPSDDCEGCREAVSRAESARQPHLDENVLALERLVDSLSE